MSKQKCQLVSKATYYKLDTHLRDHKLRWVQMQLHTHLLATSVATNKGTLPDLNLARDANLRPWTT